MVKLKRKKPAFRTAKSVLALVHRAMEEVEEAGIFYVGRGVDGDPNVFFFRDALDENPRHKEEIYRKALTDYRFKEIAIKIDREKFAALRKNPLDPNA